MSGRRAAADACRVIRRPEPEGGPGRRLKARHQGPQHQGEHMKPGINGVRRLRLAGSRGTRAAVLGVAGTAAAAAIVAMAVPARATPVTGQPAGAGRGTEHFQLASDSTSQTSTSTPIIAYGVFTATGTDYQNPNGTDTFVFPGGSFTVIHTPAANSPNPTFNDKTCLFQVAQTGTFK